MLVRDAIGSSGKRQFEGYGDMSVTELLPALLTRYSETRMMIAAPAVPDQAAEAIARQMRRQNARMDGKGKLDVVSHLTLIADLSPEKSPEASLWLKDNPFGERLTLVDAQVTDTVILMPDFAITGPVNMQYGHHFVATANGIREEVDALWERFGALADVPEPKDAAAKAGRRRGLPSSRGRLIG
jgi:hypothetical protein